MDVTYILKDLLQTSGATIYMTRVSDHSNPNGPNVRNPGDDAFADDATLYNSGRYVFTNTTEARVLVSIHTNGSTNTGTDYTTALFGKWQKDKQLTLSVFAGLRTLPPAATGTEYIATREP